MKKATTVPTTKCCEYVTVKHHLFKDKEEGRAQAEKYLFMGQKAFLNVSIVNLHSRKTLKLVLPRTHTRTYNIHSTQTQVHWPPAKTDPEKSCCIKDNVYTVLGPRFKPRLTKTMYSIAFGMLLSLIVSVCVSSQSNRSFPS